MPEGSSLEAEAPDGYIGMAPDAKIAFIGAWMAAGSCCDVL
jgi:hypothetical protein